MDADTDLDCRQAARLLSLACERELEAGELVALHRHLGECLMCTRFNGAARLPAPRGERVPPGRLSR